MGYRFRKVFLSVSGGKHLRITPDISRNKHRARVGLVIFGLSLVCWVLIVFWAERWLHQFSYLVLAPVGWAMFLGIFRWITRDR